jgi:hypothetical protein
MTLEPVAQIAFDDLDAKCPGFVLIKLEPNIVGVSISLETDGDIDIFLTPQKARDLALALEVAANQAEGMKK